RCRLSHLGGLALRNTTLGIFAPGPEALAQFGLMIRPRLAQIGQAVLLHPVAIGDPSRPLAIALLEGERAALPLAACAVEESGLPSISIAAVKQPLPPGITHRPFTDIPAQRDLLQRSLPHGRLASSLGIEARRGAAKIVPA